MKWIKRISLAIAFFLFLANALSAKNSASEKPSIYISKNKITVSDIDLYYIGSFIPTVFFFESADDMLDTLYLPFIKKIAERLTENPDLICEVRGYYSREYDKIFSPRIGEDLAYSRSFAVAKTIIDFHPELESRIFATAQGYDIEERYSINSIEFDARVSLVFYIPGWTQKSIIASEELPFWRKGFRKIAEDNGAFLRDILKRNRDIFLVFSSGDLEQQPIDALKRIDVVVEEFRKKIGKIDAERFIAFHRGIPRPGELIVDIVPLFIAPEPWIQNTISFDKEKVSNYEIQISMRFPRELSDKRYRIDYSSFCFHAPIFRGISATNESTLVWNPFDGTSPLLAPQGFISLGILAENNEIIKSNSVSIKTEFSPSYSEIDFLPVIPFKFDSVSPSVHFEAPLLYCAGRINWLTGQVGKLKIKCIGYANSSEVLAESLAVSRSGFLHSRLVERLAFLNGKKSNKEITEFLSKKGVEIELIAVVLDESNPDTEHPWANITSNSVPIKYAKAWAPFATIELKHNEK